MPGWRSWCVSLLIQETFGCSSVHHQRSRYIFDLFYKRQAISQGPSPQSPWAYSNFAAAELYDFCVKEGYADKYLIAKWRKVGFSRPFFFKNIF